MPFANTGCRRIRQGRGALPFAVRPAIGRPVKETDKPDQRQKAGA
ncbi:hypothetical protein [Paenibacillus beijingensis]|nr:hypothetical protein [Paenibacillus beijingensis]